VKTKQLLVKSLPSGSAGRRKTFDSSL